MKNIALIGNVASMILNFRKELVIALINQGYTVYCFAYGYSSEQEQVVQSWGAIPKQHYINPKGLNPIKDVLSVYQLYQELKKLKIDIAFNTFAKPVIFGSIAAKLAKVPKIIGMIEGLGNAFTESKEGLSRKAKILRLLQVYLYKISLPLLDKVIFLNPDDKKDLIDGNSIKVKESIILGGIGVDLNKFAFHPIKSIEHISFLFIARFLKEKGVFEFLEAAEKVKSQYPQVKFTIIGDFDSNNPFALSKNSLDRYINENIVEYLGYVDNVAEVISNSSVFVLPSYREGVPRSSQEAMAIGRAIITTNVPGCRETVIDGINGFLIMPYSSGAIIDKMNYFIENPSEIVKMGINSRKLAEEKFNVEEVNNKLISIIQEK